MPGLLFIGELAILKQVTWAAAVFSGFGLQDMQQDKVVEFSQWYSFDCYSGIFDI